ncbi:hypothetical protein F8388_013720 [Cannabis sativa]|uniref:Kinesin motor domain-containing protein n=1 Tax=Cannabis sativa TaxID=3483 RepID=A0A7J6G302_CANSA|nr:hypothetical protein F8388_013720 [Cannabis sativa]KAF4398318.1 hypothetical protein G4B88_007597 [Cannabis sativa]
MAIPPELAGAIPLIDKFQSVLDGYNGIVMAYGQRGTGKTFTIVVHVKRSVMGREDNHSIDNGELSCLSKSFKPLLRKSKLIVVDLAGSERIHKSVF